LEAENLARRRDRVFGLLIIGSAFLAGLCISWWARGISTPSQIEAPAPPTTRGVTGFPHKVDVLAALEAARTATKRVELRGLKAVGVASDGTVDVSATGRGINMTFASARGQGPQPPRPPGTLPRHEFCGRQHVRVNGTGLFAEPDMPGAPCIPTMEPLPGARCGPKQVWQAAIKHGMPADQLANITYFRSIAGPSWRFEMPSQHRTLVLYGDCERELTGSDAVDATPTGAL
jgi:hypothetical protein